MGDLRALVSDMLGCASVYASSDPCEVRCLVDPLRGDSTDVQEWLIRQLPRHGVRLAEGGDATETTVSEFPQSDREHSLEKQLDAILGLVKHRRLTDSIPVEDNTLKAKVPHHVLDILYNDIPRYSPHQPAQEIRSGLMTKQATPRWASFGRLRGVVETTDGTELAVFDYEHQSLQDLLKFNQSLLDGDDAPDASVSDAKRRFLVYQLWELVKILHDRGLSCNGSLIPSQIWIMDSMWIRLGVVPLAAISAHETNHSQLESPRLTVEQITSNSPTERWCSGDLTNFEYLMILNAAAGRRMVDSVFHPVLPWVSDFSSRHGGWRDLSKSKFRLNKGDNQLDRNYESSVIPHHITESLSEITFYIYMARRTPMTALRRLVRSNFQPKEYPSTMERMFQWTPDECIPEFFSDASVFSTIHGNSVMPDMVLPNWCADASDFIRAHRMMLESDEVSIHLHKWVDLNFGVCLSGDDAVRNKNVPLKTTLGVGNARKSPGFIQLFHQSHPQRRHSKPNARMSRQGEPSRGVSSRCRGGTPAIPSSADADLQAAIQIAEDAMGETSFYTPVDNSQHGQLQGILSSPAVAEKKSLSSSFVKLKKKHKTRPKFSTGSDSSPVSPPAGKESGQSRSPTMARFAHAIPKFFGADSPRHQSGVYSDQGSLATAPSTVSSGSQLQSSSSFGPSVGHHDSGRGVSHPRPGSAPLAAAHSTLPPTIIPSSAGVHASQGTHIFRDLWHQLSRLEDGDMNDSVDDGNRMPDLEWTGADFHTLDDTSLLLLRACPPIRLQSEPNDLVDHPRAEDTVEPVETVAIHPVYALPTSWNTVMEKDGSISASEIAFSADLFSVGCMMAEIYTGRPLFCARSVGYYYSSYVDECGDQHPETTPKSSWPAQYAVAEQLSSIPADIKNTIIDFVHPHPRHRISAWRARSSQTPESCYQRQHTYATDAYDPCNASIFPPGFRVVYEYSAQFSRTKHWWDRLEVVRENLPALVRLPDTAFRVAVPSILNLFNSESYTDTLNTAQVCAATVYLLDGLARRLGRADTRLQLLDVLLRVYETSDLPPVLKLCMSTPDVLKTILTAFGPVKMLRHFFPPLIDWLTAPPVYRRRHDDTRDDTSTRPLPLFSSEAANMLATSLGELCSSDFMGPSIAVKHILPSLLPLLGKVQAKWTRLNDERSFIRNDSRSIAGPAGSRSAYGGKNGDGIHVAYVQKQVLYENHYVADAILLVCRELPSSVVGEIVLPHLCDVVPQLVDVAESVSSRIEGVPDELAREVYVTFRVLRNVVRSVAEQTVQSEFLQRRASMLIALVNRVQPPFLHPRTADAILSTIKSTARTSTSERPTLTRHNSAPVPATSRRSKQIVDRLLMLQTDKALDLRAFTAIGVARTVTAALLKVGAECAAGATGILQSIDAFLVRCAAIYSELEASDYQWSMASEVVSEFCSPLRTLFGSEAFAKFLPSVQSSSVLQMLLLPNPPSRKGDVGALDSFQGKEAKKFLRQTTLVTNRVAGDEGVTADHIEVAVLARHVPELLQGAYRSARLNGIKTASFLHVSLHFGSVWDQDLNEAIFLAQEQRKKRRAASTSNKAGGDAAWLRPRASSYFSARQDDPARANVSLPAFAGPASELLGRSWPLRGEIRHNIRAHSSSTRSIHVDQDEDIVVSASKNGSCRVWRLASYPSQPTGTVHFESTNLLSARSLEDGKRAVATSSTAVHVWDIRSSQVMFHIPFAEEGVTSCTPLRMLPFKHYQDFAQSARASPSQEMFALQGHADFAVSTARKLSIVDARAAPRVVADWRVDTRASTCISTTALVITPANGVGLIASGTTSGQVFLTDKRMGKCIYHWQALVESRVVKIVQYAPSYILVVGSDREARVWKIDNEKQPRLRMIVANVPEGVRETQVSVQAYADSVLLYVAASAKLYTTRLIHDASPEAVRSEISTVRLESWSLLDNLPTGSGAGVNNGIGGDRNGASNSPERGRLHRTKMSAQSVAVLPLRQVVVIGGDDGSLRTCV